MMHHSNYSMLCCVKMKRNIIKEIELKRVGIYNFKPVVHDLEQFEQIMNEPNVTSSYELQNLSVAVVVCDATQYLE